MRRLGAISMLVVWLLAPTGGVGLALHGIEHRIAPSDRDSSTVVEVVTCSHGCSHPAPAPVPTSDEMPTDDRPADDDEPSPACSLCEALSVSLPMLQSWSAPSAAPMLVSWMSAPPMPVSLPAPAPQGVRSRGPPAA
ncbi:MAG: hypothetical protein AAF138_04025 [Planctomycetota bacterium]